MNNRAVVWIAAYDTGQMSHLGISTIGDLGEVGDSAKTLTSAIHISKVSFESRHSAHSNNQVTHIGLDRPYPSTLGSTTSGDVGIVG